MSTNKRNSRIDFIMTNLFLFLNIYKIVLRVAEKWDKVDQKFINTNTTTLKIE